MKKWFILLIVASMVFGSSAAFAEETPAGGQQGGFLKGLTDVLGNVAQEGLQEAMDQWLGTYKGRIGQVDLVERRGNTLVLDVTYEKVKRRDGVSVNGRVLQGGFPLDGFETSLSPISGKKGRVRLTIRKSGGSNDGWGASSDELESDQVELFLLREGHEDRPFGNLAYDLTKVWTDNDEPDVEEEMEEGGEMIELAEGETEEGAGDSHVSTRPFVIPGTILSPVQVVKPGATQAAQTAQPLSGAASIAGVSQPATSQPTTGAVIPGLQGLKVGSYDFFTNAAKAEWRGSAGTLSFPGSPNDRKGFVRCIENGRINPNNAARRLLQTHPTWQDAGRIGGLYPEMTLDDNVHLRATGAFLKGAKNSDGATFIVRVLDGGRYHTVLRKKVSPQTYVPLDADLSRWSGKKVRIFLGVAAGRNSSQDWTVWVKPRLDKGGS
jgi:hypothetical protein